MRDEFLDPGVSDDAEDAVEVGLRPRRLGEFVGQRELKEHLGIVLEAARRRRQAVDHLLFAGPPGLGKTTLVEDFLSEIRHGNPAWLIARGRCSERLAGAEAYLPFLEALDSLVDSLTRHLLELPARELAALLPPGTDALTRLFPVLRRLDAVLTIPWQTLPSSDPHEMRRRAVRALWRPAPGPRPRSP